MNEICRLVPTSRWRHCSEQTNPADLPSRGVSLKDLLGSSVWFNGPSWLTKYWIIKGKAYVMKYINCCTLCRRFKALFYKIPPPPPLPSYRVEKQPLFSFVGVDPVCIKIIDKMKIAESFMKLFEIYGQEGSS